jgi:CRISPR-associated endonuclease Csn1
MNKIKLGIDVGTNSLGWAVLEKQDKYYDFRMIEDENGNILPAKGSYIFSKGSQPNESSKAAERRGFRGARRRIDRIRLRKIGTLKVLEEFHLCPEFKSGELNRLKNKKIYPSDNKDFIEWQRTGKRNGNSQSEKLKQPYYLRHLAATKEGLMDSDLGKLQLGRAFYHLSQRRGYLSNAEDEQTEDNLEIFKIQIRNILETVNDVASFIEPFNVVFDLFKKDIKVKTLGNKILKEIKKNTVFESIKTYILKEFDKPENLGTVMKGIGELSQEMEGHPTMGSYFYSIYSLENEKNGMVNKIRGRYTHREEHYLAEFNYICDKQNINGALREKLENAIFYQRPLKSQKGLVANCTLEPKRKKIGLSHPLFEEFRLWESINRIKIKREDNSKLDFLTKDEKERIKEEFIQASDFEFSKLAKKLSNGKSFRY